MFCYQCEETSKGTGCTTLGICGKDDVTAAYQDALIYSLKGLAAKNISAKKEDQADVGLLVAESLFMTLTNVNFDKTVIWDRISEVTRVRNAIKNDNCPAHDSCTLTFKSEEDILKNVPETGVMATKDEDVRSLRELLIYGLKGIGAYYSHAVILGYTDTEIELFLQTALASTIQDLTVPDMISKVMECGSMGVKVLELLDTANTKTYGNPEITTVSTVPKNRPGILVTGHDLKDLAMLLEQSKDAGIDIYTHGEMLPAHAYPGLKKYSHLVGNYGGSWPHQKKEFESFNGPVLVTTNCIVPPKDSYKGRIYTTGLTGFPGVAHVNANPDGTKDFSILINQAKTSSPPKSLPSSGPDLITGCAHNAVLSLAEPVIGAIKAGDIKRFVVMAGCDGRQKEREYYTTFAQALPSDAVILTAGCAKFRYNYLPLGDIGGIPRVIDAGQCNDSYSLVVIAKALAEAFNVGINDLPISYNIAWYEQKAVLVLLALLSLGVKNITLGPKLPAFVSPAVLKVLVEQFGIAPNTTVDADMKLLCPA
ncbi:MAG: hydroxylamine reductase [Methanospirillum sp.]|nr:hydroxylamine reductase [Methanospirillum sp.]